MTDSEPHTLDWTETDGRWSDKESTDAPMSTILYDGFVCPDCEATVSLHQFDPDPDGPCWYGNCPDCGERYNASPSKVTIDKMDPDL